MFVVNLWQWLIKGYLNLHSVIIVSIYQDAQATKHKTVARIFLSSWRKKKISFVENISVVCAQVGMEQDCKSPH